MRFVVPAVLLLVALIHALPLVGVVSAAKISSLYGIAVQDSNLEILMRHRAVLFGLLAAFLAYAAFHRHLHSLALIAATASVVAFLALAVSVGNYNSALSTVVKADALALALHVIAAIVHLLKRGEAYPSLKRSANGRPPGPGRWYAVHLHWPGPGGLPLSTA